MTITLIVIALVALIPVGLKLVRDGLSRKTRPAGRAENDPAEKDYWRIHGGQ
jgi:hypothetical protein